MLMIDEYPGTAAAPAFPRRQLPDETRPREIAKLPSDAREWVDPCTLSLLVQDGVDIVLSRLPGPPTVIEPEAKKMLELLTFAYAANVLASESIAAACKADPAFRFLSGGQTPFPHEITRFRRRHRLQLEDLLTRVLSWVACTRVEEVAPALSAELRTSAKERLDIARHLDEMIP